MCGIAGIFEPRKRGRSDLNDFISQIGLAIEHRGPDASGTWHSAEHGFAMVHRRLSIIDLSEEGRQPMASRDGRFVVSFNGEIYNYREIRKELEAAGIGNWRGSSDTEILLEAVSLWGIQTAIEKSNGMFAIAIWDTQSNQLTLVRDRAGKKPVYFGWLPGGGVMFASELKCFWKHPRFEKRINRKAVQQYLRYAYVPGQLCIYENVYKLQAGCTITIDATFAGQSRDQAEVEMRQQRYWSIIDVAHQGQGDLFQGSAQEAIDHLEQLLTDAVGRRMFSDVPLGAFLSGGIDSSIVVALMRLHSSNKVKTFTIGYESKQFNEAAHAKAVAKHLGTDHTELILTPKDALDVIPLLSSMYDEPFADSSQIPTYLVSKLARKEVTVALSGDGGDEVFGGYNRHIVGEKFWNRIRFIPGFMRKLASGGLRSVSPKTWYKVYDMGPWRKRFAGFGDKVHKFANQLNAGSQEQFYRAVCSQWQDPSQIALGTDSDINIARSKDPLLDDSFTQWTKMEDFRTYLVDDILVKVDRATMAVSLETRAPLLDFQLVEWAWKLPVNMSVRNGQGKWILRQVLDRHVPRKLIERPKTGFGVPIVDWLRTDLRDWAESLLDESRINDEGYLNAKPIRKVWNDHLTEKRNAQHHLWNVLMFQTWLENQR